MSTDVLPDGEKALILRTCAADMTAHGGFCWRESGLVTAPDWDPTPECGHGLHGLLWGEGDGSLLSWDDAARWLVAEVVASEVVGLGRKVKVPRANVIYCGDRHGATGLLAARAPGRAIVGGTSTSGDRGTSTSGDGGTSTSGYRGTSTSGDGGTSTSGYGGTSTSGDGGTSTSGYGGTSTSGDRGTSTSGYRGTSTSGDRGTSTSGDRGTSTSGDRGTSTSGDGGTSTSGYRGTSTSGDGGVLIFRWYDGARCRAACFAVGEDGLLPNVPYRMGPDGKPVRVDKETR